MGWKGISFALKQPFLNLTPRAKTLLWTRLLGSVISVVVITLMITLPYMTHYVYVARLDCSHVDVSNGLFSALKSSARSGSDSSLLTTSEIQLLAEYTQDQVSSAPQFITSNLMNWCFGSYNSTEGYNDQEGKFMQSGRKAVFVQCTSTDENYVFDYRGELSVIGLNIILAYAYGYGDYSRSDSQTISSTSDYVPDAAYLSLLRTRKKATRAISGLLYFSIATHLALTGLCLVYYSNRGLKKDDHYMPMFTRQLFGFMSLVALITVFSAVLLQYVLITQIESNVSSELGSFGLSVHKGTAWFTLAWFSFALAFLSVSGWGGPIWCDSTDNDIDENVEYNEEGEYAGTSMRKIVHLFDTSASEESYIDDYTDNIELRETFFKGSNTMEKSVAFNPNINYERDIFAGSYEDSSPLSGKRDLVTRERSSSLGWGVGGIKRNSTTTGSRPVVARDRKLSSHLMANDLTQDIVINENNEFVFADHLKH